MVDTSRRRYSSELGGPLDRFNGPKEDRLTLTPLANVMRYCNETVRCYLWKDFRCKDRDTIFLRRSENVVSNHKLISVKMIL